MPYARKDLLTWQKEMYHHIYNRGAWLEVRFTDEEILEKLLSLNLGRGN